MPPDESMLHGETGGTHKQYSSKASTLVASFQQNHCPKMWFHTGRVVSYSCLVGMGLGSFVVGVHQWCHHLRAWSCLWTSCLAAEHCGSEREELRRTLGTGFKVICIISTHSPLLELMAPSNQTRN